jgi:hypothetical protein
LDYWPLTALRDINSWRLWHHPNLEPSGAMHQANQKRPGLDWPGRGSPGRMKFPLSTAPGLPALPTSIMATIQSVHREPLHQELAQLWMRTDGVGRDRAFAGASPEVAERGSTGP